MRHESEGPFLAEGSRLEGLDTTSNNRVPRWPEEERGSEGQVGVQRRVVVVSKAARASRVLLPGVVKGLQDKPIAVSRASARPALIGAWMVG